MRTLLLNYKIVVDKLQYYIQTFLEEFIVNLKFLLYNNAYDIVLTQNKSIITHYTIIHFSTFYNTTSVTHSKRYF